MDFGLSGSESESSRILKQCRPMSEVVVADEVQQPAMKLARTTEPGFSGRQELSNASTTTSSADDHHGGQAYDMIYNPHQQQQQLRSSQQMGYSPSQFIPIKQQQQYSSSLNSSPSGPFPYYPFTASQWAELEHQALIFKYMMARAPVPPELVNPFRRSLILSPNTNSFQLGVSTGSPMDAEPGRCRRTDGKKWRCSRPIVADQKYCERHIHRGRNRSRKAAEAAAAAAAAAASNPSSTNNNNSNVNNAAVSVHHHHQPSNGSDLVKSGATSVYEQKSGNVTGLGNSVTGSGKFFVESGGYQLSDSVLTNGGKDQRFVNGMSKDQFDLRPEQLLFSEVSGSCTRQLGRTHHQSQAQAFGSLMQQQPSSIYGCDTILGNNTSSGSLMRREPEAAALRHFFVNNDWPRGASKNENSWCDEDESFGSLKLALQNRGKGGGSDENEHEDEDDTYTNISLARINSAGGDLLADVLKSPSTLKAPTTPVGFNLSGYGGGGSKSATTSSQQQQQQQQMILSSPTGVLQKVTCFSDSSSSASSPGSVKNEASHAH